MRYVLSYGAHGADRSDFDLIEDAILEVGRDTDKTLETVWEPTSDQESAAGLITEVGRRLRRMRNRAGLGGLSVSFHAAQIHGNNSKRRNVGVWFFDWQPMLTDESARPPFPFKGLNASSRQSDTKVIVCGIARNMRIVSI